MSVKDWKPIIELVDVFRIVIPAALDRWIGNAKDLALMKSIETQGLFHPVAVYPLPDGHLGCASGTRRVGAWKRSPVLREEPIPADAFAALPKDVFEEFTALTAPHGAHVWRGNLEKDLQHFLAEMAAVRAADPDRTGTGHRRRKRRSRQIHHPTGSCSG